jgi:hypothetical protein
MRVPRSSLGPRRRRPNAWPEALIYSGIILLLAALASALIAPSLRLIVIGMALIAVLACVGIVYRKTPAH